MHNTPIENAAFRVTFTETNLLYLLGAETPNKAAIARCKKQLKEARQNLKQLKSS
jgi:hypothetical protein